ncbi:hypothetical protein [Nocardioides baekrokdamisoli]|uniref:hypothetical protein n=1 Tax=Nocardioides baekrokdamisoli TaxID=1804624 RepID=UPI000F77A144|nr:hypothetical protein [Nocardioides baekrokdamisoli]
MTRTHAVAGPGHPAEHHRIAYSVEAIVGIGLVVAGVAAAVAVVGFFTGSWLLGSFGFPALMILVVLYAIWTVGRGARHEDSDKELHDIE